MTTNETLLDRLRLGTAASLLAALGMLGTVSAAAQDAEEEDIEDVEEVVVTGTRLSKTNVSSSVPLLQIGAQEIDNRGIARLEDIVNILPSVFVSQTTEVANGSNGTATLDLRGLGAVRTLVLLDGKRLPFGSASSSSVNVDFIPAQLVERIDVVTGGASSVYGSDAVAGVVNFVTKRDFEGFQLDAQFGINQNDNTNEFMENVLAAAQLEDPDSHWGGEDFFFTGLFGANVADGRGNVTAYVSYSQQAELLGANRDTGACTIGTSSSEFSYEGIGCIGSSNFRRFFLPNGDVFQQEDGTLTTFRGGPNETYNFGARNHYQRPVERWNINVSAFYEITDGTEVYLDAGFMNNNTSAQIAESASFFRPFQTNCENPLLQAGLGPQGDGVSTFFDLLGCGENLADGNDDNNDVSFLNSHRNVEGDPRISIYDISTWRVVTGYRGDIDENFSFDTFVQYATTRTVDTSINDLNFERVQQALFIVDDGNGGIQCRDTSGGCIPWNIFERNADGSSAVTLEQTRFIQGTGLVTGDTSQLVAGGTIEGDLTDFGIKSPFSEGGLAGLVGVEYREDNLVRVTDDVSQIAGGRGLTGTGGATLPIQGDINVFEIFAEVSMPIVEDAPFAKELGINAGYRYSDYTTEGINPETQEFGTNSFSADTWFVGASWTPIDDIRFRVNYSVAIRAPNVFDLFVGANTGLFDLSTGANGLYDPCSSDSENGIDPQRSFEECARTGVTASQYGNIPDNPAGQFNLITGGNAELVAETATSLTLGVVYTPSYIPNLSIAIDYFDITVEDAISSVPALISLERCLDTGDEQFCNLIQRDSFGSLWLSNDAPGGGLAGVSEQNANVAELTTSGIDINIIYTYDTDDWGTFGLNYQATLLDDLTSTPFEGGDEVPCAGLYAGACGAPNPEYRHRAVFDWAMDDFSASVTWRFNGATDLDGTAGSVTDEKIETRQYFDLSGNYQMNENVRLRAGILNVFGVQPPLSTNVGTGTGNNNTYPGFFDTSRTFFVGVNFSL